LQVGVAREKKTKSELWRILSRERNQLLIAQRTYGSRFAAAERKKEKSERERCVRAHLHIPDQFALDSALLD